MKKRILLLFLLIVQFRAMMGQNNLSEHLNWDVTPIFIRDMYGKILDTTTITFQCIFYGDTSMNIVFDYDDILTGKKWDTHCYTAVKSIIASSRISQIILESEFGEMIPLSDNINFPTYQGYINKLSGSKKSEFNFDLLPVRGDYARSFKLSLSVPIHVLKICQDNQKVRLHYLYRAKEKYLQWSPTDYLLTSEWFSLSDIR